MPIKKKPEKITINVNPDLKEQFYDLFNGSNCNSVGEFLGRVIDHYTDPETTKEIKVEVEKIVEVEKVIQVPAKVGESQILIELNDVQMFALQQIANYPDAMIKFNKYVEKIKAGGSLWWDGAMKSDFKDVYELFRTETIEDPETIKHNMKAHLINTLMYYALSEAGHFSFDYSGDIKAEIREFIKPLPENEIINDNQEEQNND
jgi:hypothetical protein